MSGDNKKRWQIAPGQEQFTAELLGLQDCFATTGNPIYQARNTLKHMVWQGRSVIVKSFAKPSAVKQIVYSKLRKSKARRSFENALHLRQLNMCTPQPIGYIEHYDQGNLTESFYVCAQWQSMLTIREPLCDLSFSSRAEILADLGRFAWELHRNGVYHRDFSPGNILIAREESGAQPANWQFCLVDVNRVRFGRYALAYRMRNFAMLWATDADLELIIKAYAKASGEDACQALSAALRYSRRHKRRAAIKEQLKSLLRLH